MTDKTDLAAAFARGTLWSVTLRWGVKLIGLVNTLALARLLVPADFGVVAIAMICVGFIEVLFAFGNDAVILRDPDASKELIDSAWTLKVLEGVCAAAAVALISPFAASFFNEPRLIPVLLVLCIGIVIQGFVSYGPMLARKDLNFSLEVRLTVSAKFVTFIITIVLAVWLRSYWALVIGTVAGYAVGCTLTYAYHSYRPRFTTSHIREIWGFSQWMLVASVGQFFMRKSDEFLVARIGSTSEMGLYSVSADLGQTVSVELSGPINRASLPVMAQLDPASQRMRNAVAMTIAAANILILPAGFGLAAVSEQAVSVVLGSGWSAAGPLLAMFSIVWALRYMTGLYSVVLIIKGKPSVLSVLTWVEAGVLVALGLAFISHGVEGLAWARCGSALTALLLWIGVGSRYGIPVSTFAAATWRPLFGAALMFAVLQLLPPMLWPGLAVVDLLARILLGALIYTAWIGGTWHFLQRPDGIEARAIGLIKVAFGRMSRRT